VRIKQSERGLSGIFIINSGTLALIMNSHYQSSASFQLRNLTLKFSRYDLYELGGKS
jgi:sulfur relay (sulfurtransferase) DsrF/TusC family protein